MQVGIWDAVSGTSGTLDTSTLLAANDINNDQVRIKTISVIGDTGGGSVQIDNRAPITVPAGSAITLTPNGTIVNPVLIFTNTTNYIIEFVTTNFRGYTEGNI
jgi:hypothetical protein